MPRLQHGQRTSLLATRVRNAFLEAFTRQVAPIAGTPLKDAVGMGSIARRVQGELRRTTGHYYPLHQVVTSIYDIDNHKTQDDRCESAATLSPPTPHPRIVVTSSTPANASMSRRRMEHNIPSLQCQLAIPPPAFDSSLTASRTPTSLTPTGRSPLLSFSRRFSLSAADSAGTPITPVEQIVHTPLTPPKLPRVVPPPPRSWARLNFQARMGETSPLASPDFPLTPYELAPTHGTKPVLGRLQIPGTSAVGDLELRDRFLSSSPQAVSPLYAGCPARTNSTSSLTRTALLRAARPSLSRTSSLQGSLQDCLGPLSPLANPLLLSASGQTLASPFDFEGGYFSRS
ncbi:hypothetical protein K466DRAFT_598705 [Polyporus arcularius HHB13444]|uniref:Uncharacterized protein n=1 Tax=Polyporus arcularius HHB13444 TaxID=1314778 RepID=A0A5C3PGH3_9APHY|nr:hypothetical protein K466DRAFT_598705 [Polyporus arcularius HHB13444]